MTLPQNVQGQLLDITGRYRKDVQHARDFYKAFSTHAPVSPRSTKAFQSYKREYQRRQTLYQKMRKTALHFLPPVATEAIGPLVRAVRGTNIRT